MLLVVLLFFFPEGDVLTNYVMIEFFPFHQLEERIVPRHGVNSSGRMVKRKLIWLHWRR